MPDHGISIRGSTPRKRERDCRWVQPRSDYTPALTTLPASPGLNVHSMLKHQTLVLTLQTVAFLEKKLLWQDSRYTPLYPFRLPYCDFP